MIAEPADLHRVAPLQVKDQVYERLRESLIDLTFAPGQPLREAALVERFGVSKTPIREALVRLERDGLVEIAPYRGARASIYSDDDVRQFYEVRAILEIECVRRAAGEGTLNDALAGNLDATESALARGDLHTARMRLAEFDDVLLSQFRNVMITDLLRRLQAHLRRIGQVGGGGVERLRAAVTEHTAIARAIAAGDAGAAQQLHRHHLDHLLADRLSALTGS